MCFSSETKACSARSKWLLHFMWQDAGWVSVNVPRCHTFQFGVKGLTESCTLTAVTGECGGEGTSRIGEEVSLTKYPDFVGDGPGTSDGSTCCTPWRRGKIMCRLRECEIGSIQGVSFILFFPPTARQFYRITTYVRCHIPWLLPAYRNDNGGRLYIDDISDMGFEMCFR